MTTRAISAAFLILSLLVLAFACKGSGSNSTPTVTTSPNPFILSEDQKVVAIRIIGADGRVADLINRNKYGIGKFLPWTTQPGPDTGRARLFGVIVEVIFETPFDLEYDWPFAIDRPLYSHWASQMDLLPYDEQVVPYAVKGARGAVLHVDFERGKVVAIQPQPYDELVQPPLAFKELTEEEKTKARTIFEGDAGVQELLSGRDYSVRAVKHWFLKDRSLGAGLIIDFSEPQSIEADWPYIDVDDTGNTYTPFTVSFEAPDVARLDVLVDFATGEVAGIIPSAGD